MLHVLDLLYNGAVAFYMAFLIKTVTRREFRLLSCTIYFITHNVESLGELPDYRKQKLRLIQALLFQP